MAASTTSMAPTPPVSAKWARPCWIRAWCKQGTRSNAGRRKLARRLPEGARESRLYLPRPSFCSSSSSNAVCAGLIRAFACSRLKKAARSTSGKVPMRPECGGHSIENVLLLIWLGSQSLANAHAWTILPLFWVIGVNSTNGPCALKPSSSSNSRLAASSPSSPGWISPFGIDQMPASFAFHSGPPGCTSRNSNSSPCTRYMTRPALAFGIFGIYTPPPRPASCRTAIAATTHFLQNRDNAEAAVLQDQTKLNYMQTSHLEKDWLIRLTGIAVVVGDLVPETTYLGLKWRIQASSPLQGYRRAGNLLRNARLRCRTLGSCLSGGSWSRRNRAESAPQL